MNSLLVQKKNVNNSRTKLKKKEVNKISNMYTEQHGNLVVHCLCSICFMFEIGTDFNLHCIKNR